MKTRKSDLTRWGQSLTTALLLGAALLASAQTVEIPDPGLQATTRAALDKPTGDITVEEMESLIELDASIPTRGFDALLIRSLHGLQSAINLASLDLGNGQRSALRSLIDNAGALLHGAVVTRLGRRLIHDATS